MALYRAAAGAAAGAACGLAAAAVSDRPPWTPDPDRLLTRWAALVDPLQPHGEYPRPGLVRESWTNLNGLWDYAIRPMEHGLAFPEPPDGRILVPFPLESALSGVGRSISAQERLFCRRTVELPAVPPDQRLLLHIDAVDWGCKVFWNGAAAGDFTGGYERLTVDLTDRARPGANELVVEIWDPCDEPSEYEPPRGKQVRRPEGIWYTSVTGIWQTAWIERVPAASIERVRASGDPSSGSLRIGVDCRGAVADGATVAVVVRDPAGAIVAEGPVPADGASTFTVASPLPWSPEAPALYDLELRYGTDRVRSYAAFRSVDVAKDPGGTPRIRLNGQPYFMLGTLDQGWWPDGLYTPPTHAAALHDLEVIKALGFNTVRKHVKVESETWYAACDRLGLLVWQDMPSSGPSIGPADPDADRAARSAAVYEDELRALIDRFGFHPCIVMWVPFNEGWGQFETARITALVRALDPSRLVNAASGWTDRGVGDVLDLHDYAASLVGHCPEGDGKRAIVLGEFGGLGLPVPGHLWRESGWGYRSFSSMPELFTAYTALLRDLGSLVADGLSAAIYTQTTDVELEVNGLMTYDRDVLKMNSAAVAAVHRAFFETARRSVGRSAPTVVVPTARDEPDPGRRPVWRWHEGPLPDGWERPTFDDSDWAVGPGGFGTTATPGAAVGTPWDGREIGLRRTISLPPGTLAAGQPPTHLLIHHDEDAEVYLDGVLIASLPGFTTRYARVPLPPEVVRNLTPGDHLLAIRCRQTAGGQYIDAGFIRLTDAPSVP